LSGTELFILATTASRRCSGTGLTFVLATSTRIFFDIAVKFSQFVEKIGIVFQGFVIVFVVKLVLHASVDHSDQLRFVLEFRFGLGLWAFASAAAGKAHDLVQLGLQIIVVVIVVSTKTVHVHQSQLSQISGLPLRPFPLRPFIWP